jgi:hypothetical protein
MKCRRNVERIAEICAELMEIIDDSRAHCENDECELIHCVVHDSVQQMWRAVTQWKPEGPIDADINISKNHEEADRPVN